jgi:hypothetical protein
MPDVFQVFKDSPGKHSTLKILWPALYEAFAGPDGPVGEDGPPPRYYDRMLCPIGDCGHPGPNQNLPRRQVVARLERNGTPACAQHVAAHADRPGGWPLKIEKRTGR